MPKKNYDHITPYVSRPYHALSWSDGEGDDDDVDVWNTGGPPDISPLASFEQLVPDARLDTVLHKKKQQQQQQQQPSRSTSSSTLRAPQQENAADEATAAALASTRRNLTRISQFVLKLEARAGKATKEGIRATLDATVADTTSTSSSPSSSLHAEAAQLAALSEMAWQRLYLVDRSWRRTWRATRDAEGVGEAPTLLPEDDVREWLRVEARSNHLAAEDTCYFTVADLLDRRRFGDWVAYLRRLCEYDPGSPGDEKKLVELAWRFLDRNLRVGIPCPRDGTGADEFADMLERKRRNGDFDEAMEDPKRQEREDDEAWRRMRRYWSSRALNCSWLHFRGLQSQQLLVKVLLKLGHVIFEGIVFRKLL
ncbi:hypothetical protein F4780DRAFT_795502 [Xylariomycetidae sp. FL0641]|nr:hypothetical protein F4780DRAFT_795502 [Xylariomycetidae sp. FL0641]